MPILSKTTTLEFVWDPGLSDEERQEIRDIVADIFDAGKNKAAPKADAAEAKSKNSITNKVYHGENRVVKRCIDCPDRAYCESPCAHII